MLFAVLCVKPVDTPGNKNKLVAASCDECHTFPGSAYCRVDGFTSGTKQVTTCSKCHMGAVKFEKTITDSNLVVYHDKMVEVGGIFYPALDSLHADKKVDVNPGRCDICHGYPPTTGDHTTHVVNLKKNCNECHFSSTEYVTLPGTLARFRQKNYIGMGEDSIPRVDALHHRNKKVDVRFLRRAEDSTNVTHFNDTLHLWDPFKKSCGNMMHCHRPSPNFNHYQNEVWKKD